MRSVVLLALAFAGASASAVPQVMVCPPVYDGALRNPLKGFIANLRCVQPDWKLQEMTYITLARHCIRWDELESVESDGVDRIRAFCDREWSGLAERNIKVIPRVYLQWSGPQWSKRPGDWWTCWPKDMKTGDWESEQFKDRVRKFVKKLGEAWDDDPRVAWVQMAILGAWGEHHAPGFTPEMEKVFGDAFTAAFRNKKVTVRRPEQFADYTFGVNVDNWNDANHWKYPDRAASAARFRELIATKRRHLVAPIEGEIAYGYGPERMLASAGLNPEMTLGVPCYRELLLNSIRWFGGTGLGWIGNYRATNEAVRAGADLAQRAWGYRYELDGVEYPACVEPGRKLDVTVRLHNTGSASFYYKWPVTASLLDPATRKVRCEGEFDTDIRTWRPGEDWDWTNRVFKVAAPQVAFHGAFRLPETLARGRYVLALAVLDPAGRRPSLRFATRNYFKGGRHPVGYVTVGDRPEGPAELTDVPFDDPNADDTLGYEAGRVTVVRPALYPSAIRNPLKGFRPDLKNAKTGKADRSYAGYASLRRDYIRWTDLEECAADGVEKIRAYGDRAWKGLAERNVKVIPRIHLQWSGPKWAKNPGDWWTCWPKDMTTGDWESEQFKDRVRNLVRKLGEAWDDDPRIAWIQMGIMGAWGEHHAPGFTPEMEKVFGDAFAAAFRNKKVLVRQGNQFADYEFGLVWESWADRNQWEVSKGGQAACWMRDLVARTRRQMFAPIEGEVAYGYKPERLLQGPGLSPDHTLSDTNYTQFVCDTVRVLGGSALGWIHNYHPTNLAIRIGASNLQKTLGYRYELDEVRFPSAVARGGTLEVGVRLRNTGSAPFYYRWPVTASLLDPVTHQVVWEGDFETDIRTWLPGEGWDMAKHVYAKPVPTVDFGGRFALPRTLADGSYILALAVLDPAGRRPSLRFATRNYFKGGRHPVGYVTVGEVPTRAPGLFGVKFDDPNGDQTLRYDQKRQ